MFELEKSILPESIWRERRRLYWITSRAIGIAALVLGFHYLHPVVRNFIPFLSPSSSGQMEATGIFATVLLTFILIAVYRDIGETQSNQTDIQKQQKEFIQSIERPRVQVEGYRPGVEGNHSVRPLEILLSNIGRNPASDVQLEIVSGFPKNIPLESAQTTIPLQRQDEPTDWNREWGTYLEGDERKVRYTAEPLMISWKEVTNESGDNTDMQQIQPAKGFGLVKNELSEFLDDDRIRVKGSILYEAPDGTEYSEHVFDKIIKLTAYGDLGSALERGERPQAVRTEYEVTADHKDSIWVQ